MHMPKPRGNLVNMSAFVDANHAGNVVTCRLHRGIIIFDAMLPSFGTVNGRIQSSWQPLAASLLHCGYARSWLSH